MRPLLLYLTTSHQHQRNLISCTAMRTDITLLQRRCDASSNCQRASFCFALDSPVTAGHLQRERAAALQHSPLPLPKQQWRSLCCR